ncbi:unnamed protein product [Protopolystoma xenopodis]|uniref:Uncharacterized protein n=1 Tax=Protopolystoma xenopodis TaxID=117903 RepID=A0A448XRD3_9PLAT|nr:unnamed protein product [Protopolystoma xenopodis]
MYSATFVNAHRPGPFVRLPTVAAQCTRRPHEAYQTASICEVHSPAIHRWSAQSISREIDVRLTMWRRFGSFFPV